MFARERERETEGERERERQREGERERKRGRVRREEVMTKKVGGEVREMSNQSSSLLTELRAFICSPPKLPWLASIEAQHLSGEIPLGDSA